MMILESGLLFWGPPCTSHCAKSVNSFVNFVVQRPQFASVNADTIQFK